MVKFCLVRKAIYTNSVLDPLAESVFFSKLDPKQSLSLKVGYNPVPLVIARIATINAGNMPVTIV